MGTPPDRDDPQESQGGWQSSGWQSSWQQPQGGEGWQQQSESSPHASGWQQTADGQWVQTGGGTQSSGKSTAALVLGILGLVLCPLIFSILALVFGHQARREIDASNGRITGRGNATAGIVLGWIGIVLVTVFVVLIVIGVLAGDPDTTSPTEAPTVLLGLRA